MDKMIAFCGFICTDCAEYLATQKNDDKERERLAGLWAERKYRGEIKPADINCDGCLSKSGRLWVNCRNCPIRKCGLERHVKNCAYCSDYICTDLESFFSTFPEAKSNLEEIRKSL
ncbi:MAG TPA: DUF3795 domain-containing protein [Dehalococcoidales bacterium]